MDKIKRMICLGDTDSTGVLYFPHQLRFATELFEAFLSSQGLPLGALLKEARYLFPVVQATSRYMAPLFVSDTIELELLLKSIGESSVTLMTRITKEGVVVGETEITHVLILKKSALKTPLPPEYRNLFAKLKADEDLLDKVSYSSVKP